MTFEEWWAKNDMDRKCRVFNGRELARIGYEAGAEVAREEWLAYVQHRNQCHGCGFEGMGDCDLATAMLDRLTARSEGR